MSEEIPLSEVIRIIGSDIPFFEKSEIILEFAGGDARLAREVIRLLVGQLEAVTRERLRVEEDRKLGVVVRNAVKGQYPCKVFAYHPQMEAAARIGECARLWIADRDLELAEEAAQRLADQRRAACS